MSQNTIYITDNEININQDTTPSSFKRTQINTLDKGIPVFKFSLANILEFDNSMYKNNYVTSDNYYPLKNDNFLHSILNLKDYIFKLRNMINTTNNYFPLKDNNYNFTIKKLQSENYKFSSLNINIIRYLLNNKNLNLSISELKYNQYKNMNTTIIELENKKHKNMNITIDSILLRDKMLLSNNYEYIIRQNKRFTSTNYPFIPKRGLYYYSTNEELIIKLKDHSYNFNKFIVNVDVRLNKINNYIFNQEIVLINVPKRFSITYEAMYRTISNIINNNEGTNRKYRNNISNMNDTKKIFNTILSNNNKIDNIKINNFINNSDTIKNNQLKSLLSNKDYLSLKYSNGYTNALFINGLYYSNNIISQKELTDFILKNFKYTIDDNIYKKCLEYDEYLYSILYIKFGFNTMHNFAKQNKDIKIINKYLNHTKNVSFNTFNTNNKINEDDFGYHINKLNFDKPGVYFTDAFVGCKKGKLNDQFVDIPFEQTGGTDITNPLGLIRYSTLVHAGIYFNMSFTLRVIVNPTGGGVKGYNFNDLNGIVIPKGFKLTLYENTNDFDGTYAGNYIEFEAKDHPIFINDFDSNSNYNDLKYLYKNYKYDKGLHVEYIELNKYINGSMKIDKIEEEFKYSRF
jgi:hypothetical protein